MSMARDSGEFELILGNKQLLSVLFIVIVLLGVFFAMGFLAGRSTAGNATATVAKNTQEQPLDVGDSTTTPPRPAPAAEGKDLLPTEPKPAEPAAKEPPPPEAKPELPAAKKEEPKKPEPAKPELPRRTAEPTSLFRENPPEGTYLQVAAARRADADNLVALLGRQGMPGFVTPVPRKTDLFRVIIGPLKGNEQIAAAREKLKEAGITNGFIVKY